MFKVQTSDKFNRSRRLGISGLALPQLSPPPCVNMDVIIIRKKQINDAAF